MLKFLRIPFGQSGDRAAVPDAPAVGGDVSYTQGYGPDYARPRTDPLTKNIEREKMNQLFFDATTAIAELQSQGIPDFITTVLNGGSPFSYAANALVRYSGALYISLAAANTALPSDGTKWAVIDANTGRLNVLKNGVIGDNTVDDTARLNVLGALGVPLFIPYTATGYLTSAPVVFSCNVDCEGTFNPTVALAGTAAVRFPSAGYTLKRRFKGVRVAGSPALRTAGVIGIFNDCENSYMEGCHVFQLDYGIVIRSYSITVNKCSANQCNTNLSAYARSTSLEINALTIIGGNYDSPINWSINIGDTSFADVLPPPATQGVVITLMGGLNTDGGPTKIDNVSAVNIQDFYNETSLTGISIHLGGSGDGNLRNVRISNCFIKGVNYAFKCFSAVNGINVERNFYTSVLASALYLISDLYQFSYKAGDATASFTLGQEVHTGFRSLVITSVTFDNVTLPQYGIFGGVQICKLDPGAGGWIPGGVQQDSQPTVKRMNATIATRFYTMPAVSAPGSLAGAVFTFTNQADCQKFNGGDRIALTGTATYAYVRSVDYVAKTALLDSGAGGTGTAISQQQATFNSTTTTYTGAAPTAGLWQRGDRCVNGAATVGQPKAWLCTVAGTPGTWVSEGNL